MAFHRDELVRIPEAPRGPGQSGLARSRAPGQFISRRKRIRRKKADDSDLSRLAVQRAIQ